MTVLQAGIFGKEHRVVSVIVIAVFIMSQLLFGVSLLAADTVAAAEGTGATTTVNGACSGSILGFPQWSNGMTCDGNGTPQISKLTDIWIIVLNIAQMLIVAAGYVAVGFFIWGGFNYIMSQGEPSKIAEAKSTLINAVIGLVIVMGSVAIINFVKAALVG